MPVSVEGEGCRFCGGEGEDLEGGKHGVDLCLAGSLS